MELNTSKLKDPYTKLTLEDDTIITAKLDDEGVVLDVIQGDEVIASTWKLYTEMIDEDATDEKFAVFGDHPIHERVDQFNLSEREADKLTHNMKFMAYDNIKKIPMAEYEKNK